MVELSTYQRESVNQLHNGCILLGGVGSGKSRTALAYYYTKICKGIISTDDLYLPQKVDLYIITTARKRDIFEWENEMVPFLIKEQGCKVVVDSWNNIEKYIGVEGAFFIFDEQRVVGSGKWAKSFIKISRNNKWILLTATPGDTWKDYIPVFIANNFYKNKTEFMREHAVYNRYITKYPKIEGYVGTKKLERYRDGITVYMNYKRQSKANTNYILAEYDRTKYKSVMKERWDIYEDEPIENISKLCYVLRKIVNENQSRSEIVKDIAKQKKKVIVFYNFDFELEILKQIAIDISVPFAEWNGHTHEATPQSDTWLYAVQYASGAEGWNCIETDTIIFYSLNYSYKTMVQAAGRIDRRNTPFDSLHYFYIYSHSPIDLAIRRCLNDKKSFNETNFIKNHSQKKHGL